jgi:hypothetical protein
VAISGVVSRAGPYLGCRALWGPQCGVPKWELTLRLHTFTHSIRQRSLKWWNDGVERVKLFAVNGKKDELLIKAVVPDRVTAERLFDTGRAFADHILIALNVASVGYFYWFLPPHV